MLVQIMNQPDIEKHPLLAERCVSHRWGPQIAQQLLSFTTEIVYVDPMLPLNVRIILILLSSHLIPVI